MKEKMAKIKEELWEDLYPAFICSIISAGVSPLAGFSIHALVNKITETKRKAITYLLLGGIYLTSGLCSYHLGKKIGEKPKEYFFNKNGAKVEIYKKYPKDSFNNEIIGILFPFMSSSKYAKIKEVVVKYENDENKKCEIIISPKDIKIKGESCSLYNLNSKYK